MTISTTAGRISAFTCVRVLSTMCSPSLRSFGEIATGPIMPRTGALSGAFRTDVHDVPGAQVFLPVGGAYDEPPGLVDVDRVAAHLAARDGHLHLLAGRGAQLEVRRTQVGARRPLVVASLELLDERTEQRRAVDRTAGDDRQGGRLGHGQLVLV